MKPLVIAGNWKSNKTIAQTKEWIEKFKIQNVERKNTTVVVCAPFTALSSMHPFPFSLGAQNVSMFDEGAYTGEITAKMIKEVADWVIIGHSERRKNFGETDEMLATKVEKAHAVGLKVIYCIPDDVTLIPAGVAVVAYEPVWAIGTGKADTSENAQAVIASVKQKAGVRTMIYGGSVTVDTAVSYIEQPSIDGILVGGASLDAEEFARLITSCIHEQ